VTLVVVKVFYQRKRWSPDMRLSSNHCHLTAKHHKCI